MNLAYNLHFHDIEIAPIWFTALKLERKGGGGREWGDEHNIPTRSSLQVWAEFSQSLETLPPLINNAPQWQRKSQWREENMLEQDYMTLALWPDCSWWFLPREKIPHTAGMEKGRWGAERGPQRVVCSHWLMGPSRKVFKEDAERFSVNGRRKLWVRAHLDH